MKELKTLVRLLLVKTYNEVTTKIPYNTRLGSKMTFIAILRTLKTL